MKKGILQRASKHPNLFEDDNVVIGKSEFSVNLMKLLINLMTNSNTVIFYFS